MNNTIHHIEYDSGIDILYYRGHIPLLKELNLTEDEVPEFLSHVQEDPYHAKAHMYFEFVVGLTAFVANITLFLLMNKHKKQLPSLVFILRLAMSVDCLLSTATLICQPVVHVTFGYMVCQCANAFLPADIHVRSFLMTMYGTGILSTVIWLPIQFAYRYHFVVEGQPPSKKRQTVYFFFSFFGFFAVMYIMSQMHKVNPTFREVARLLYYIDGWGTRDDQDFMGGGIGEFRVWAFGAYNSFTTVVCYSLVIMLELKIMKALDLMQKGSLMRQHIEINRALTALAIVPLLTAVGPIMMYMVIMFASIDPGSLMINATFTLSIAPILNPITAIVMIKPYRRTFLRWTGLWRFGNMKVSALYSDTSKTKKDSLTERSGVSEHS